MDRFDAPLAAGDLREAGGAGPSGVEAGDGVDDFLADELPVGAGDPDGAADGPAVAPVQLCVIGLPGAAGLDGVEDRFLQFRLAALDVYLELSRQSGL